MTATAWTGSRHQLVAELAAARTDARNAKDHAATVRKRNVLLANENDELRRRLTNAETVIAETMAQLIDLRKAYDTATANAALRESEVTAALQAIGNASAILRRAGALPDPQAPTHRQQLIDALKEKP